MYDIVVIDDMMPSSRRGHQCSYRVPTLPIQDKLQRMWDKYLLHVDQDELDYYPRRATDLGALPALAVWASGAITAPALRTMAEQMLGVDEAKVTVTVVALLSASADPERLERIYCVIRRAICKGAGELWWRLHLPTEHEEKYFRLADPRLPPEHRTALFTELMATQCRHCLGTWWADLQEWAGQILDELGFEAALGLVTRGVTTTAKVTPLAMHIIEREHGHSHKDTRASRHLGRALGAPGLSAIHVLRGVRDQHSAALSAVARTGSQLPTELGGGRRRRRQPTSYAACRVNRSLLKLRRDDHKGKRSVSQSRRNGWTIFRQEYTQQHWPSAGGSISVQMPFKNAAWTLRVSRAWWALSRQERARYAARARATNSAAAPPRRWAVGRHRRQRPAPESEGTPISGAPGAPDTADSPHTVRRTPWRLGDGEFPITPAELLAAEPDVSILGNCSMVMSSPELASKIDAAVAALKQPIPCWRQGFCHSARPCALSRIIDAHRALQMVFLHDFGADTCRSGDALVYLRGMPSARPMPPRPQVLEIFALITSQSLRPQRSILLLLTAAPSDRRVDGDRVHRMEGDRRGVTLPSELRIIPDGAPGEGAPTSGALGAAAWNFIISSKLAVRLLAFTQESRIAWEVALLNYSHRSPNNLSLSGVRQRANLLGPDFFNLPERSADEDPLDFAEWAELINDDEALAEDRDFAAVFDEFAQPPPIPGGHGTGHRAQPPGPPPRILPPAPPRVELEPLEPGAIRVEGSRIYLRDERAPIGRKSAMVHWFPPSLSMKCLRHDRCRYY